MNGSQQTFIQKTMLVAALWLMLGSSLVSRAADAPSPYRGSVLEFGTIIDISLWGVDPAHGDKAIETLERDFNWMHITWHAWKSGALGRINSLLPLGGEFSAAPSVLPLILEARELSRASKGLFNPAIWELIDLWGFHTDVEPEGPPPSAEAIAALVKQHPTMDDITISGIRMRSRNPAVKIDLGGFAKGYGVDRAIETLRSMGIDNAIVNAGGDLRAIGRHGKRPWHIGIRHPDTPGVIAELDISGDESVFTSGDYERFYEYQGRRYHHIIDPRTGYPATASRSVTVIHDNAATADAAATALFVAGPDEWHSIARAMGIRYVMLIDTTGTVHMNPAMQKRLKLTITPAPKIIISPPL